MTAITEEAIQSIVQRAVSQTTVLAGNSSDSREKIAVPAGASGLARMIDHTLLKPDATYDQITQLCSEAREHGFFSVCVNPTWVPVCVRLLGGSDTKVCTVTGFPLGASMPDVKAFEAWKAIEHGAAEIDMVINVGALRSRDLEPVARDIHSVVCIAHPGAIVKVIIEAVLLTDEEKILACLLSKESGADFVKTSTGFAGGGATVHDVELMRRVVGPVMGVKAAGGIRTYSDAESMIKAGATRIGASAGIRIIQDARAGNVAAP